MSNEENEHHAPERRKPGRTEPEIRYVPLDVRAMEGDAEDEIDLVELLKTIWDGRKIIYKTIAVFVVLGLAVALFSVEEYTSQVKVLPETQEGMSLGNLGGLARQFGFSAPGQTSGEGISANLYPSIIESNVFLQDLLEYEVQISGAEGVMTLKEYFSEHQEGSPVRSIVRLPLTFKNWLSNLLLNRQESFGASLTEREKPGRLVRMTNEEWEILRNLRERISASMDSETGAVTIGVKMQDPVIAADVADEVVQNLSDYIIEKRTEKARRDVEFIDERVKEAKQRFEEAQQELAVFNDANRGQLTAMARTEEQLLQSRYDLAFNIYNSLAERLEEARIKLQEETPVVTIMEPAAVPDRRSEPKRTLILIAFTLFGIIVGIGVVFVKPIISTFKNELS